MGWWHTVVLFGLLGLLALSLVIPGLVELFKPRPGIDGLTPVGADAKSQFRALQAMMAGIGLLALWALSDLQRMRLVVVALGIVLAASVVARCYSLLVDGLPGVMTLVYLVVEALMAAVFLIWPPPR